MKINSFVNDVTKEEIIFYEWVMYCQFNTVPSFLQSQLHSHKSYNNTDINTDINTDNL